MHHLRQLKMDGFLKMEHVSHVVIVNLPYQKHCQTFSLKIVSTQRNGDSDEENINSSDDDIDDTDSESDD